MSILISHDPGTAESHARNASASDLHRARSCYDHLAGQLGVALTDALVERHAIVAGDAGNYVLTPSGHRFLASLGIDVDGATRARRSFARQCLDWSERRPHLAGALGAAVLAHFSTHGWVVPMRTSRALRLTAAGADALASHFAIRV